VLDKHEDPVVGFQFLGIPPKGEQSIWIFATPTGLLPFPISRDPPEGGTLQWAARYVNLTSCFQFLGIPPKGELELIM